ncbi:hypothetical protein HMPREF1580_00514 [Gardnerella vaginalis JCP8070]|nr:hypothetical protein HMPREF1580_00514 [Gardnerella vaginalis JCP8070]EPI61207.1 hypothetical protein HMPREF1579_00195 [Gardnerella vaginalis JCP8066]
MCCFRFCLLIGAFKTESFLFVFVLFVSIPRFERFERFTRFCV